MTIVEQRNLKEHTKRVHPGFPHRERLAKGQGKLGFTTEPKPKRPRTDFEQDELAALDELPEESKELACPSCERVFYNEYDLNDHEITTASHTRMQNKILKILRKTSYVMSRKK